MLSFISFIYLAYFFNCFNVINFLKMSRMFSFLWYLMFLSPVTKAKYKAEHNGNRKKVCALCGLKVPASGRIITPSQELAIKASINKDYSLDDDRFPVAICPRCRVKLCKAEKGNLLNFEKSICYS